MQIIIVGCGKVGRTLAEQLQEEESDITLIDVSSNVINSLQDDIDAMGIVGNGASINTLMEAGIENADILIAVTGSDEMNLLCCLIAQKTGHCHTIARVRNPIYAKEISFIKKRLGVTMIINPELAAAQEISRLLRFPSAIKIDTFARGRVEMLKFKVLPEFDLDGMTISRITETLRCDVLFCAVESRDRVSIPGGNYVVHDGDMVSILASPVNAATFFKKIGLKTNQVKNAIIVGGGTISYYLTKALLDMNISVKIIEQNEARCETLSDLLPEATIINGDGTDRSLLMEEGLARAEAFVSLTNMDEENVFLALFAKTISKAKLVAKVNRLSFDDVIDNLDIGSVIYPKYITADYILQYVRAMQNSIGSNIETLYHILDNQAEALEFAIRENSPVVGIPLSELNLKKNLLVGYLNRNGKVKIPRGQDTIQVGDTVIIVTTHKGLRDITAFYTKDGFVTVALSWIVLSIMGAIPFVISRSIPNPVDALFETVSGFTTTGASILSNVEALPHCMLMWRSFTHWIGGMGVLVFILSLLPLTGGYHMNLMKAESPGPSVSKLAPKVQSTAKILYTIYFVMTVIQIVLLLIGGMPLFDTICTAFGTAGTGGFGIKNDSMASYSTYLQVVITVFMILFGVNFNAYFFIITKKFAQAFKMEEVRYYFGIIGVATLIITCNIYHIFGSAAKAFQQAAFQVGSIITTTGYATTDFNMWPEISRTILVILMFIGACAGSTGGGVKVSRILILCKTVRKELHIFLHPNAVKKIKMDGKAIPHEVVRSTNIFFIVYVLIFSSSVFLIAFDDFELITNFTAVAATFNNIGPGLELVGPTGNFCMFSWFSKLILTFDMLAGRLEIFPLLLLFVRDTWRKF